MSAIDWIWMFLFFQSVAWATFGYVLLRKLDRAIDADPAQVARGMEIVRQHMKDHA